MDTFKMQDTTTLQTESLLSFMDCLSFSPVHDKDGKLRSFRAEQYDSTGCGRISVSSALKMHNNQTDDVFEFIKTVKSVKDLMNLPDNLGYIMVSMLHANAHKLVRRVKGQFCRKRGLVIQGHMIEMASDAGV